MPPGLTQDTASPGAATTDTASPGPGPGAAKAKPRRSKRVPLGRPEHAASWAAANAARIAAVPGARDLDWPTWGAQWSDFVDVAGSPERAVWAWRAWFEHHDLRWWRDNRRGADMPATFFGRPQERWPRWLTCGDDLAAGDAGTRAAAPAEAWTGPSTGVKRNRTPTQSEALQELAMLKAQFQAEAQQTPELMLITGGD